MGKPVQIVLYLVYCTVQYTIQLSCTVVRVLNFDIL